MACRKTGTGNSGTVAGRCPPLKVCSVQMTSKHTAESGGLSRSGTDQVQQSFCSWAGWPPREKHSDIDSRTGLEQGCLTGSPWAYKGLSCSPWALVLLPPLPLTLRSIASAATTERVSEILFLPLADASW